MEIKNYHQEAQVSGVESRSFGFEMNAKMYDILISKMYTNKQGAVIRELSANAWDAHVEAGNSDKPFDLHLPTWLDKTFYIRDYGTGIPHDKFEHIYTNVGASTKEDSNDLIGGFGLGSKTPFTMTDTFMVENHYEGVKTTWICFKDKGEPQVSKVAEEPTSEPSGLKVSFSFDEGDVNEFTHQVPQQLRFFPVKPNITGGEGTITFTELPDDWETKDYFYTLSESRYHSKSYLVMGNVGYIIDPHEFDYSLRSMFSNGLTLKAPIGAVDIPPSRENLEMTPRTKAFVTSMLDKIKKEYVGDVQTQINKCNTKWEVRKLLQGLNYNLLNLAKVADSITWKGQIIDWSELRRAYVGYVKGYSIRKIVSSYSNVYRTAPLHMSKVVDGSADYYVNDLGQGYSKHINSVCSSHTTKDMVIFHIDGITKKNKDTLVNNALKELGDELGKKPKLLSSVFGFPPKVVPSKKKGGKVANQVFKFPTATIYSGNSLKKSLIEEDELPKDSYYVELHTWSIETEIPMFRSLLDYGLTLFLDKPLYAIRKASIKNLDKSMVQLTPKILEGLKDTLAKEAEASEYVNNVFNKVHRITPEHYLIFPYIKDRSIRAWMRYCKWVIRKGKRDTGGHPLTLYTLLFKDNPKLTKELPSRFTELHDKYDPIAGLLSAICNSYSKERNEQRVQALATLIQSQ